MGPVIRVALAVYCERTERDPPERLTLSERGNCLLYFRAGSVSKP